MNNMNNNTSESVKPERLGEEASVFVDVEGFSQQSTTMKMDQSIVESNNTPNLQGFWSPDLLPDSNRKEVVFTWSPEWSNTTYNTKITPNTRKDLFSATASRLEKYSNRLGKYADSIGINLLRRS